jgi:Sugar-binding N-terminal domain
MRLAILADDLTAAADCALPAMRLGARTTVRLTGPDRAPLDDWDVVAWDLDTCRLATPDAAARIGRAARDLCAGDTLYLNVESAPRRRVGSAVDAALAGSGRRIAVFAPAVPALGRITADGRQHSPNWPAGGIDLIGRLRATSRAQVVPIRLAALHTRDSPARGSQPSVILACDAATDDDLERIVASGAPGRTRPVGRLDGPSRRRWPPRCSAHRRRRPRPARIGEARCWSSSAASRGRSRHSSPRCDPCCALRPWRWMRSRSAAAAAAQSA